MKLGLLSLGDIMDDPVTGQTYSAFKRYDTIISACEVADRLGFHSVALGEHHGIDYAFSTPPVILAAIAAKTERLRLMPGISLICNQDALRVAEDYATVDVISNGRCEVATGRGTFFAETYRLMGQPIEQSAERFVEAMELLCELWPGKPLHWEGRFRPPFQGEQLQPTPVQNNCLPFWVAGGASPDTALLAGRLGLKLMLPSAFGGAKAFVKVADLYREAFDKAGHSHQSEIGACWHGWVAAGANTAHDRFRPRYAAYHDFTKRVIAKVNPNPPAFATGPFNYEFLTSMDGPAIVGSPAEFIDRIASLHEILKADVNLIKMDMGGVPKQEFVDMIQLVGEEVIPALATID